PHRHRTARLRHPCRVERRRRQHVVHRRQQLRLGVIVQVAGIDAQAPLRMVGLQHHVAGLHHAFTIARHLGAMANVATVAAGKPAATPEELYAKFTVAAAVFFVVFELSFFAVSNVPSFWLPSVDISGYAVGRDFINTWMGGRSVFAGGPAAWFDFQTY